MVMQYKYRIARCKGSLMEVLKLFCIFAKAMEAKMRELERKHTEQLGRAQEEAISKMEGLEKELQSKIEREIELEREREAMKIEAENVKVTMEHRQLITLALNKSLKKLARVSNM